MIEENIIEDTASDQLFPGEIAGDMADSEENSLISSLSKKGYALLKNNDIPGAKEAFSKILEMISRIRQKREILENFWIIEIAI